MATAALDKCPSCGAGVRQTRGRTPAVVVATEGKRWRGIVRLYECVGCARLVVEQTNDKDPLAKDA